MKLIGLYDDFSTYSLPLRHPFWVELKYALKNYAKKSAKIDESELLYWGFTNEDDDEFKGPDALEYAELTHKERLMKLAAEHKGAASSFDALW